jgi:SHAQKYF class myb-like DNA-binding protein
MLICGKDISSVVPSNLLCAIDLSGGSEGVTTQIKSDREDSNVTSSERLESATDKSNTVFKSNLPVSEKIDSEENKRTEKKLRTGRWTKQECKSFEEALRKFGKHWKKVEAYVGTRSGTQIRSHAQKYFLKSKGETLSAQHNLSIVPNTSIGATHEKLETDMKVEDKKPLNSKLVSLQEVLPLSTFTMTAKETGSKTNIERSIIIPCRYLMEHMRKYGFNELEEIYARFSKLSDWVENV